MKITIEMDVSDVAKFLGERDRLLAKIQQMQYVPVMHSLDKMAIDLSHNEELMRGFTPDQKGKIVEAVKNYQGLVWQSPR